MRVLLLCFLQIYGLVATSRRGLRFLFQRRGPSTLIEVPQLAAKAPEKNLTATTDNTSVKETEKPKVTVSGTLRNASANVSTLSAVSWAVEVEGVEVKKEETSRATDVLLRIQNERWVARQPSRPDFVCRPDKDLIKVTENLTDMELQANDVIVKTEVLSIDGITRKGLCLGMTCRALGVGIVIATGSYRTYKPGTRVIGPLGAQLYAKLDADLVQATRLEPKTALGLCGRPGLTAYAAFATRRPKKTSEPILALIADAHGPIGVVAAQLCRLLGGARCLGLGPEELVTRGITDAAIDLRFENQVSQKVDTFLNGGLFDYVFLSGTTDSVLLKFLLERLKVGATVIIVQDSIARASGVPFENPCLPLSESKIDTRGSLLAGPFCDILAEKDITIQGFNFDHHITKMPTAALALLWLRRRKRISYVDTTFSDIESFPALLASLSVASPFFDRVRGPDANRARAIARTRLGHLFLDLRETSNIEPSH